MDQLQDKLDAMNFTYPEHIPVIVSILPATWIQYREELEPIVRRHPLLFGEQSDKQRDYDWLWTDQYQAGEHVDAWGCVWSNTRDGMDSLVSGHPLKTREAVHSFNAPAELTGRLPHGFMFLRLADLRGFEEIMVDFAEEPPELQMLIDIVFEYNMKELEALLPRQTEPIFGFADDLGMQASLPMKPETWRKYLKPCYMKLYQRCHQAGYAVFMHTDGHIYEIIPDLVDCGVNVVNAQFRANGLDNLVRVCKDKVCVDLDLDRQLFPFCKPEEIDAHVHEVVEKLGSPKGGLWLNAEMAPDIPLETIEAICVALEKYRSYYTAESMAYRAGK